MFYKRVTDAVQHTANNVVDPPEQMIVQLLFIRERKYRYKDAVEYMRKGYKTVAASLLVILYVIFGEMGYALPLLRFLRGNKNSNSAELDLEEVGIHSMRKTFCCRLHL